MKLLITGAKGQLGQDITKLALETGYEVLALGSKELDITSFDAVSACMHANNPDIIINCAAYNAVDQAETDWKQAFLVNGIGPKNLALAATATRAILVHYSTDYIFNGEKKRPYTIADSPCPLNRYGESKLLGEQMVLRHAARYYLIRVSWVFGAGNTNFVLKVLEWSNQKRRITIVDDQVASPTYTRDLARASLEIIKKEQFGLFHITNAGYCSRYQWAEHILCMIGWTGDLIVGKSSDFNTPAIRPHYSVLDNFGTQQVTGYDLPVWKDATDRFLHEIARI